MLMGFLSALGIAGNLIHDYLSRNEGMDECNKYIARYGRQRGLYEYNFLRGLSLDNRIERLADMFFYDIPYSDMELKHIKENVDKFVEPQWSRDVLDKYKKETGEHLTYILNVKWEREGNRPRWAEKPKVPQFLLDREERIKQYKLGKEEGGK